MKTRHAFASALIGAAALASGGASAQNATADEAVAMVRKSVAAIKAGGRDKTIARINDTQGPYRVRDLYLTIDRMDGTALAHGANQKMVGLQRMDSKDVDGKKYMRERFELARTKAKFWQDIKFSNPASRKIEPKAMYCERLDEWSCVAASTSNP
ncbi:MAG: cache domain-containing protein [Pseudomonadota bacterium]|nr:cache domain-containing protein [Pseudomonadota bacterium]